MTAIADVIARVGEQATNPALVIGNISLVEKSGQSTMREQATPTLDACLHYRYLVT